MYNIFKYLTSWSLLISYCIFIWTFFIQVPVWIFMFAACLLTITSILGTFFITLPLVDDKSIKHETSRSTIILIDAFIHVVPLIVFLLGFNYLKTRLRGKINLCKTLLLTLLFGLIYLCHNQFENNYDFDALSLGILAITLFFSSYQVYSKLLKN